MHVFVHGGLQGERVGPSTSYVQPQQVSDGYLVSQQPDTQQSLHTTQHHHTTQPHASYNTLNQSSFSAGFSATRSNTAQTFSADLHSPAYITDPSAQRANRHTSVTCLVCCKVFSGRNGKYNLEIHMRIHTGETPFVCTICPYKAKRKHHLQRHMTFKHPDSNVLRFSEI